LFTLQIHLTIPSALSVYDLDAYVNLIVCVDTPQLRHTVLFTPHARSHRCHIAAKEHGVIPLDRKAIMALSLIDQKQRRTPVSILHRLPRSISWRLSICELDVLELNVVLQAAEDTKGLDVTARSHNISKSGPAGDLSYIPGFAGAAVAKLLRLISLRMPSMRCMYPCIHVRRLICQEHLGLRPSLIVL
jgi:hypothetical protein